MKARKGTFLIATGSLFLIVAIGLTLYNIQESKRAGQKSEVVVEALVEQIPEEILSPMGVASEYEKYPEKEMPTIEVDGERYIAVLEIPDLGLQLPVIGGEWTYAKLRQSPCRYSGSIYKDNLVIAAHNYDSHFGRINELKIGSSISLTDVDGNKFQYVVAEVEILKPTKVELLINGESWDLTLFTCTYSGKERFTLRCIQEK